MKEPLGKHCGITFEMDLDRTAFLADLVDVKVT